MTWKLLIATDRKNYSKLINIFSGLLVQLIIDNTLVVLKVTRVAKSGFRILTIWFKCISGFFHFAYGRLRNKNLLYPQQCQFIELHLFIVERQIETDIDTERKRERAPFCGFTPQMSTRAGTEAGQSLEPIIQSSSTI